MATQFRTKNNPSERRFRIAIIGNSAGGKSRLARKLATQLKLPMIHIDSIQFLPGLKIRSHNESIKIIQEIQNREAWIIDGYGPLDILEARLALADLIIFIDLPIWQHYWWVIRRQITNIWKPREELPPGCNELTLSHTKKLFHSIFQIHQKMRPEMLRILGRDNLQRKVQYIRSKKQLTEFNLQSLK